MTSASLKNILVPLDLGEASKGALDDACTLAGHFGASLHLISVVQDPFSLAWAPGAPAETLAALLAQMQQDADAHLQKALSDDARRQFRAELTTCVGQPGPEILSYARKHAIDLIVIGRGRPAGDVQTNQLRSAIESVVRDAPCPVLVI